MTLESFPQLTKYTSFQSANADLVSIKRQKIYLTLLQEFDGKPKAEDTTTDMQGPTIVMCMAKELRNCIITRTFRVSPTKGFLDNPPPYQGWGAGQILDPAPAFFQNPAPLRLQASRNFHIYSLWVIKQKV